MTTITISPPSLDEPLVYHYDGTLTYNGAITYANLADIDTDGAIAFYVRDTGQGIASAETFGAGNVESRMDVVSIDASSAPSSDGLVIQYIPDAGGIASSLAFDSDNHVWFYAQASSIISGLAFGAGSVNFRLDAVSIDGSSAPSSDGEIAHSLVVPSIPSVTAFGGITVDYAVQQDTDSIPSALSFGAAHAYQVIYGIGFSDETIGVVNVGYPSIGFHATYLDPLIYIYDPNFYNALYAMETYCYNQTDGVDTYSSGFSTLSTSIVAYIQKDRSDYMRNFINSLFSYCVMNTMYGSDGSLLGSSAYNQVWSMNGYNQTIRAKDNTYYADGTGDMLTSDATTIDAVVSNDTDDTAAKTMISKYNDTVSNQVMNQMFELNPPAPNTWTKATMNYKIFTGLGYEHVYKCFVTGLTLPTGTGID